ncbi:helicase, partial [Veillonellaceae bacterium M2-8]|nr:helicase [Veillonellaceae bacterium M2-8]
FLISMVDDIRPKHDIKLQTLYELIDDKQRHLINPGNKKILIFTAFADTADYLYENVSKYVKDKYQLDTALITGTTDGKTTLKSAKTDLNTVLTLFSPIS